ncbi:MAG: hypothetical protein HHJ12_17560 [Glaciimonas sp.]|nr:hypothetical protein [Glaciimonas sp.]
MVMSPLEKQIKTLEERARILDSILEVAKTPGGRITEDGKDLYFILRKSGLTKSQVARVLQVTPAALTKFGDPK